MFSEPKIRCLLVHDHILLRQGLRRLLEDEPDLEVIAEADDHASARACLTTLLPDAMIADPATLGLSPSELEHVVLRASPQTKVLFLASNREEFRPAFTPSACEAGRVTPQTSADDLLTMVRNACRPESGKIRSFPIEGPSDPPPRLPRNRTLTAREREVLKLLAEGRTVRSAASMLGLSRKTVEAHKFNLMRKLGVHNKTELVLWAIQQQLVKVPANF